MYGGRYMIVMDFVDGHMLSGAISKSLFGRIEKAVDLLHSAGLVFGYLRLPNILIKDEDVFLVDFDWCRKEGEGRYPVSLNQEADIDWPEGVGPGCVMKKEHDVALLRDIERFFT
jgi:RIO-like serine/threonine protein kinase